MRSKKSALRILVASFVILALVGMPAAAAGDASPQSSSAALDAPSGTDGPTLTASEPLSDTCVIVIITEPDGDTTVICVIVE